jgi:hypothetical protein
MLDITSANATVAMSVAEGLFSINLENFSADSSFTSDTVQAAETRMGVDGHMAAGFTPAIKTITINLEAGSPSTEYMQLLRQVQEVNMKPYKVQMVISIPSIGKRYTFSEGVLQSYKDLPDGQNVLSPTQWVFHFEGMSAEGL